MTQKPRRTRNNSSSPRDAELDWRPLLAAALARRAGWLSDPQTTAGRVFHAAPDGVDGLVVERLGHVLVAQLHAGRLTISEGGARELCAAAAQCLGASAVYRKTYPKDRSTRSPQLERQHRDPRPWIGEPAPPEFAVSEGGMRFLVRPYDGYATGLFLDHRSGRACVRQRAAGRRVLNAFAYTCGFTVAAALGGATLTVSVDISRKVLEWGRQNLVANEQSADRHRFICDDIFAYYRRAARQGQRFDYIILDPPTFARAKAARQTFSLVDDLDRLVAGALALLDPGGLLQLSVNHRGTSFQGLEKSVHVAACAHGRSAEPCGRLPLPEDFRGDADYAKSTLFRVT